MHDEDVLVCDGDLFAAQPGISRLTARLIRAAFDRSAIDIRHTVLTDFDGVPSGFINSETSAFERPTTAQRNAIYVEQAPKLFAQAARGALQAAGVVASEITHVVTASCTGFFAPGPDFRLVRDLGIPSSAQRDHVGFLGCAAAFPALRAAYRICAADPGAVVLVACGDDNSVPGHAGARGDHYVELKVVLPQQQDPELSRLVEEWSAKHPYTVRGA